MKTQLLFAFILVFSSAVFSNKAIAQDVPGGSATGFETVLPVDSASTQPSTAFQLTDYANTVAGATINKFVLSLEGDVLVVLYNAKGQLAGAYYQGYKGAGTYYMNYFAANLASGKYVCQLTIINGTRRSFISKIINISK